MSESDISVILNELKHIKADIAEIKQDTKDKCSNCINAALAKEKISNQWYHICALWSACVLIGSTIGGALWLHVAGK